MVALEFIIDRLMDCLYLNQGMTSESFQATRMRLELELFDLAMTLKRRKGYGCWKL